MTQPKGTDSAALARFAERFQGLQVLIWAPREAEPLPMITRGVLFVFAAWSGPAHRRGAMLADALRGLGTAAPPVWLVDSDALSEEGWRRLGMQAGTGYGETLWFREAEVVWRDVPGLYRVGSPSSLSQTDQTRNALLPRPSHLDACLFNGIPRSELCLGDVTLHGTHPMFVCAWCVDFLRALLDEDDPVSPPATQVCSFCGQGARSRLVSGLICDACILRFHRDNRRPGWAVVMEAMRSFRDLTVLVSLAASHWDTLAANGVSIGHLGADVASLVEILNTRCVKHFVRFLQVEQVPAAQPATTAEVSDFIAWMATHGVAITTA